MNIVGRGRCFGCRRKVHSAESRVVWLKDQRIERRLCLECLEKRGLSLAPRPYRKRAVVKLCTKCHQRPRRPGQRWCRQCASAYMVGRRYLEKKRVEALEAMAGVRDVPRDTPESVERILGFETRRRISETKIRRNVERREARS